MPSGQKGTPQAYAEISLGLRLSEKRNATKRRRRVEPQGSGDIHILYDIKTTLARFVS